MLEFPDLDALLTTMLRYKPGISDLNFTAGRPPQVEVDGRLESIGADQEPLTGTATGAIAHTLIGGRASLVDALETTGSCDTAHTLEDGSRVRVNVFRVRGEDSIVLRALPAQIPTLESLGLPPVLGEVPPLLNGLVLVTGSTGSGKTTTMTAILDAINRTRPVHVVTLEDPIEFVHDHRLATVNQRELGTDFGTFAGGLKAALRQAPKVIFVGEVRDRETMETCLKAAETGHLVLSTLHTIDAGQTVNRIVGMFDLDEQRFVRARLADSLRWVVSQRLLPREEGPREEGPREEGPREEGGRVAAIEVMGNNLRVRELVLQGEDGEKTFRRTIADGRPHGWQTFDQHIVELLQQGLVSETTAVAACSDASFVQRAVDQVRAARGEDTSELGDLEMAYTRKMRR